MQRSRQDVTFKQKETDYELASKGSAGEESQVYEQKNMLKNNLKNMTKCLNRKNEYASKQSRERERQRETFVQECERMKQQE